jgi:hypothetical protein
MLMVVRLRSVGRFRVESSLTIFTRDPRASNQAVTPSLVVRRCLDGQDCPLEPFGLFFRLVKRDYSLFRLEGD